jgi:hypothetical protein
VAGSVSVRAKAELADDAEKHEPGYEPLAPQFTATVPLTPEQSLALSAGQIGAIRFHTAGQSKAASLVKSLDQWIRRQIAALSRT